MFERVAEIAMDCELGESPVWDARTQTFWWTDIEQRLLHHWSWADRRVGSIDLPERLGSFGLTTDPSRFIAAFETGFAFLAHETAEVQWIERPEVDYRGIRFNDGRVDRQGRFWAGSMVEDTARSAGATGSLYRLDPDGSVRQQLTGVSIANGICFSPDGRTIYFADSPTREIRSYHIGDSEPLGEGCSFAVMDGPGVPDGSDVDAAGGVWNAQWAGAEIVRYDTDGALAERFPVPVSQPTSLTFGGPDLRHVFVTTARAGLSAAERAQEPLAGSVLVYSTRTQGNPAPQFVMRSDLG